MKSPIRPASRSIIRGTLRFIELMPVRDGESHIRHVIASEEVLKRASVHGALESSAGPAPERPGAYYQFRGAPGTIGVITPMTHTYCGSCKSRPPYRRRRLRTCLYGDHEVNLRDPLRGWISAQAATSHLAGGVLLP